MKDLTKNLIGLFLCLIGIWIYLFPLAKIFILIPIMFFIISIFIKKRIWSIILNIIPVVPFIILYLGFIIPTSKSIIVESRIRYQMIDIGQGDFIRNGIEYKQRNQRIFLQDTVNGIHWLYVDSGDFKKLWPEPPFTMKEKNYTIKAKFKTYRLLNGEYAKATLIEYDSIKGCPMITK
jgi:energy-coupling factor transporter transmembrane protein EcfT